MRDSIVTGTVAGLFGAVTFQAFIWIFYLTGVAKTTPFHLGAYISLKPGYNVSAVPAQALGAANHLVLGTLLGLVAVILLHKVGTDHPWLKGLTFGGTIHFLIYGVLAKTVIPVQILQPDLATSTVFLFGNLIFGLITILIAAHYLQIQERI